MRRKRMSGKINTKLILDVIGAELIVRKVPDLISSLFNFEIGSKTIATAIGTGVGFGAGMFLKRNDLKNASIAVGAVELVSDYVDDLLGGLVSIPSQTPGTTPPGTTPGTFPAMPPQMPSSTKNDRFGDYYRLNGYVSMPRRQSYDVYNGSY